MSLVLPKKTGARPGPRSTAAAICALLGLFFAISSHAAVQFAVAPGVTLQTSAGFDVTATFDQPGNLHLVVLDAGAPVPTSAEVIAGTGASGAAVLGVGGTSGTTVQAHVGGLGAQAGLPLDVYVVGVDTGGDPQAAPRFCQSRCSSLTTILVAWRGAVSRVRHSRIMSSTTTQLWT